MNIMSLLSIVTLGFFLGMRHATDPDHVIAVTTIVARHRTIKHAAIVGASWGLGHTLTILAVESCESRESDKETAGNLLAVGEDRDSSLPHNLKRPEHLPAVR